MDNEKNFIVFSNYSSIHCKKNPAPIQLSQSFSFGGLGARVYVEETKTK